MIEPSTQPREESPPLAWVCVVVWALGAASTRWVGVWWGIATAANLLGLLILGTRGRKLVGWFRGSAGIFVVAGAAAVMMLVASYGLYPFVSHAFPLLARETAELYARFGKAGLATLTVLVPTVLSEELVWRGEVQQTLSARLGPTAGAMATGLVYGAAHLPAGVALALLASSCGLFWSGLRARTGSLWVPLVSHLAWDLCVMVCFPLIRM